MRQINERMTMNKIERLDNILREVVQHLKIIRELQDDSWMSIKTVSFYSTLSESTIRRAINKGHLKVYRSTGKLLFKRREVDLWLKRSWETESLQWEGFTITTSYILVLHTLPYRLDLEISCTCWLMSLDGERERERDQRSILIIVRCLSRRLILKSCLVLLLRLI